MHLTAGLVRRCFGGDAAGTRALRVSPINPEMEVVVPRPLLLTSRWWLSRHHRVFIAGA